jgi:uncharacterized RDD family membrane protein YckC
MPPATTMPANWPGKKFGLPERGSRSIARGGRRACALALDWAVASVLSLGLFPPKPEAGVAAWTASDPFATLGIFAVLQVVFIATAGGSIGHLVFGLRVVPLKPGWVGVVKPIARTVLLCLAIPAVIWDRDQRGMHDRLVGTLLVRA